MQLFDLGNGAFRAVKTNPLEGRLLADGAALLDQAERGEHVGDVVEAADLRLELLLPLLNLIGGGLLVFAVSLVLLAEADAVGSALERNHVCPRDKQVNELLAQDA